MQITHVPAPERPSANISSVARHHIGQAIALYAEHNPLVDGYALKEEFDALVNWANDLQKECEYLRIEKAKLDAVRAAVGED